jgi:hypothetical protein
MLLYLWKSHTLHEHRSQDIYIISEVVSYSVLILVNSEVPCVCPLMTSINGDDKLSMLILLFNPTKKHVKSNGHGRQ